jgi:hypothetical protein
MDATMRSHFPFCALKEENPDGLLRTHPRSTLVNRPVICWTSPGADATSLSRRYGVFASVEALYAFYMKLPPLKRTGFEVILGDFRQKPHFDVDIASADVLGDNVIELLVDVIVYTFESKGLQLNLSRDLVIYTSHGDTKQSYHVVLPNHAHATNLDAKAFADQVRSHLPQDVRVFVDARVYNPLQQFRLLGSTKVGKNRVKVECASWYYHGTLVTTRPMEGVHALRRSLISATEGCTLLTAWPPPEPSFVPSPMFTGMEHALALLANHPHINIRAFRPKMAGSVVHLVRKSPSECVICERVHEHENAFLSFNKDRHVIYSCYRACAENLPNRWVDLGAAEDADENVE